METQKAAYYQTQSQVCLAQCSSSLRLAGCHLGTTVTLDLQYMCLGFSIISEILQKFLHQEDAKNCINTL